jgi:hypothetical protein
MATPEPKTANLVWAEGEMERTDALLGVNGEV